MPPKGTIITIITIIKYYYHYYRLSLLLSLLLLLLQQVQKMMHWPLIPSVEPQGDGQPAKVWLRQII